MRLPSSAHHLRTQLQERADSEPFAQQLIDLFLNCFSFLPLCALRRPDEVMEEQIKSVMFSFIFLQLWLTNACVWFSSHVYERCVSNETAADEYNYTQMPPDTVEPFTSLKISS